MAQKVYRGTMELKSDGEPGEFKAVFATIGIKDHDGDVTTPGAFTAGQEVLIEHWNHGEKDLPVGKGAIREDGDKAVVEGAFFLDTATGKDHYTTVKRIGGIQEWSYTFNIEQQARGEFAGEQVRFLKRLDCIGVAPVSRGAGIGTGTMEIKNNASDAKGARGAREGTQEGKAVTRSEADGDHPASHYLVVEDPESPTTWHLRVRNADGELDHRLMGAAWAALHGGYRGNVYEGPGKEEAVRKLTGLYEREGMDVPKAFWDFEEKAGDTKQDAKVGRVVASRNHQRILRALEALSEVLKDAGLLEDADDSEGDGKRKGLRTTPSTASPSTFAARTAIELLEMDAEE